MASRSTRFLILTPESPLRHFSTRARTNDHHIGIALGVQILDLHVLSTNHVFDLLAFDVSTLQQPTLNEYAALGRKVHGMVKDFVRQLVQVISGKGHLFRDNLDWRSHALVASEEVMMHLPMSVGAYTDFFPSPFHAQNVCIALLLRSRTHWQFFNPLD